MRILLASASTVETIVTLAAAALMTVGGVAMVGEVVAGGSFYASATPAIVAAPAVHESG